MVHVKDALLLIRKSIPYYSSFGEFAGTRSPVMGPLCRVDQTTPRTMIRCFTMELGLAPQVRNETKEKFDMIYALKLNE